ncbi:hypothetical protein ABT095_30900 [Kitasatospora sp. NPDC002227]|uniref:hypothetical protein n=1 Tax=Kitasatospora sp. NPDC002227 TaxID=3154773 RepID=UPI00332A0DC2
MTKRKWFGAAAATAALVGAGAMLTFSHTEAPTAHALPGRTAAVAAPESPRPSAATTPPAPQPSRAPATTPARPAPHILDFAHGSALPTRTLLAPTDHTAVPADADGCQHAYGAVNQCVPRSFPVDVPDTPAAHCIWLLAHGYTELAVHGTDPAGLDTNHDGTACGPGDAGGPP